MIQCLSSRWIHVAREALLRDTLNARTVPVAVLFSRLTLRLSQAWASAGPFSTNPRDPKHVLLRLVAAVLHGRGSIARGAEALDWKRVFDS